MWNRSLLNSKFRATGIHLGISGLLFGVVLYFILVHWYPGVWFSDGGWQGVRIMIAVDLVLGPALTFVIIDPAKSRRALAFDFSLIGLIQAAAFVWGVIAVHQQRPIAAVYWDNAFNTIDERSLKSQGKGAQDLLAFDSRVPALIFAEEPKSAEDIKTMVGMIFAQEISEFAQFQLFRPVRSNLDRILSRQGPMLAAVHADARAERALKSLLKKHSELKLEDLRFVFLSGRYEESTLVLTANGEIVGLLPKVTIKNT